MVRGEKSSFDGSLDWLGRDLRMISRGSCLTERKSLLRLAFG